MARMSLSEARARLDETVIVRMTMSEARELLTVLDDAEHARVCMGDAPVDVQEGLRALVTNDE